MDMSCICGVDDTELFDEECAMAQYIIAQLCNMAHFMKKGIINDFGEAFLRKSSLRMLL